MTRERALRIGGYAIGGFVALALLLLGILWGIQAGKILPNTSVAGVDVSRMSPDEATRELASLAEERREDPVVFLFEDERFEVVPEAVGYRIDIDATVQRAMSRGRTGLVRDIRERVRSLNTPAEFDLVDRYDPQAVAGWVSDVAEEVNRDVSPGAVTVDPATLEVEAELPHGSAQVRQAETIERLVSALDEPGSDELDLPVDTEPQRVPDSDVRAVSAQLERAVSGPLELTANDEELVLAPAEIARIVEVVEREENDDRATLELIVTADTLMTVVDDEDAERFAREPRDATYASSRTPPTRFDAQGSATFSPVSADVEVEDGQDGTRFDPDLAAEQITELLRSGARGGELKLERIDADFPTQLAQQLKPSHLIGTFTTYHPAGQSRVTNIQRLADVIDNTVVMPGEQFSINEISGQRTCAKGYVPAGTIVRGELVDTCGGGTSQFGTTTFNAAFFAGVQLDQWKAHSWYISRYPMGREATLSYPVLDVKFTNITDGAIIVRTSYTPSSITVSLYGQPIADAVSASHGNPTNRTEPREIRRTTNELCEDVERVEQSGFGGFTVNVTRTVDRTGGGNDTQTIRTVYVPQNRIVEVGTRDCPSPDEEDSSEDDGNDDDDDGDDD